LLMSPPPLRSTLFPYTTLFRSGEGLSHAWVEIEDNGYWYGLDPTKMLIVNDHHIKISHGRDYKDCTINQGVFIGNGVQQQTNSMGVERTKGEYRKIKTIAAEKMPVNETQEIKKSRCSTENGGNGKRISIVTGIHGDELEGQYVCYEVARRIQENPEYLHGTVDIYPAMNPLGIDSITRGIPGFDLDM